MADTLKNPSREWIIEAMRAMDEPVTREQLVTLVGGFMDNHPDFAEMDTGQRNRSVGMTLRWLGEDGIVIGDGESFYLTGVTTPQPRERQSRQPQAAPQRPVSNGFVPAFGREKGNIAPFYRDRVPVMITLETSPPELEGVIRLEIRYRRTAIDNDPVQISLPEGSSRVRICMAGVTPRWSPYQTTYRNVAAVLVTYQDANFETYNITTSDGEITVLIQ